ncbi:MAG: alpha-L-fucosidase [Kiritimatiellae bacterium]|nr:alpha-L-fucosidase [Kiritimatiellia bacterium]
MTIYPGRWHGRRYYFGLHYDFHAVKEDTELGTRCGEKDRVPMLKLMAPDFVQTDCKGHAGYTSWFSKAPHASVSPGVVKDAMKQWRAATRKLGLPLHCHYSGVWDKAAGAKHPAWCIVTKDGTPAGAPFGTTAGKVTGERMCPRGPYVDKLMIPQMLELIDRYGVDGFWVDGDIWATEPCYCKRCRKAFAQATGIRTPPREQTDPHWAAWWNFTRESFEAYATRYCNAVHAHKPGVLVCSNWLQTFNNPGAPNVPTDWISGDNSAVWGLDGCRCEARFISTRGKPWDIMLWSFYRSHGTAQPDSPWAAKPVQMLQQEAAMILAFGGNVQLYENPSSLRNGQLIPWRQQRMGEVGRFVKARRALCQDTETIPQVAVLRSEYHFRAKGGRDLMWSLESTPVQGAVWSLLESHFGVDILDEWALLPRLRDFPLVIAPEQDHMSTDMVKALKAYVSSGGKLLVSGPRAYDRFGAAFLGVKSVKVKQKVSYHVPAADGATPVFSDPWRLLKLQGARSLGRLGQTPLLDERLLPHPAATIHKVGKGQVAYVPCNIFRDFTRNRYPLTRALIGEVTRALAGRLPIEVQAPTAIDVILRKKRAARIIHLINRSSGIPNQPNNGAIDEIPSVGPVTIRMKLRARPRTVRLKLEKGRIQSRFVLGMLTVTVPLVHIHAAVMVE